MLAPELRRGRPGARGWLVVAALFTVTFSISNPFAAFGVFLPIFADVFGWSRGSISIAISLNLLLGGVLGFAVGAIADRHGPRSTLVVTASLGGVGFALAGTVTALWQLHLYIGVMAGAGMCGFYVIAATTVARWFAHQRGLALGVVLTGFNLGFMTGGPLAAVAIEHLGWRVAYGLLGGGFGLIGVLAALFVTFPPSASPSPRQRVVRASQDVGGLTLTEAFGEGRFWSIGTAWLVNGAVLMTVSVHVVPYARDAGISLERAALGLTAYGVGAAIARVGVGALADRLEAHAVMHVCAAMQIAALLAIVVRPSEALLLVGLGAFGFGFAGSDTLFVRVVPEVFGVKALGAIMGVLSLGWRCGAALGPTAAGYLRDATGSCALPFGAAPFAVGLTYLLFVTTARRPR